jgi:hypothetical protein
MRDPDFRAFLVPERGELKTPHKESPIRKGRFGGDFSYLRFPQNTRIYCLSSLRDSGFRLALPRYHPRTLTTLLYRAFGLDPSSRQHPDLRVFHHRAPPPVSSRL